MRTGLRDFRDLVRCADSMCCPRLVFGGNVRPLQPVFLAIHVISERSDQVALAHPLRDRAKVRQLVLDRAAALFQVDPVPHEIFDVLRLQRPWRLQREAAIT